ncbi:hypothetical protein NBM05_11020 [Rothia sp. AR01]|uniref:Phosphoribosyltransferase domain-containing protein n=1 Tax=Rothia santali TaxID=2949643 RepID=A0A9X2HBX2_9MICC|nr:phosphoribosyltransferase family protein [Rothia santali]MCP3426516.1 hypothetical protein [Rothia santali]
MPVPSASAAFRRRGFVPAELLARRALRSVRAVAPGARVVRLLAPRPDPWSSCPRPCARPECGPEGLGARQRARRIRGSLRMRRPLPARAAGAAMPRIVIVDDVLTTGASLCEARRALEAGGAAVAGAVVLATVAPPGGEGAAML